MSAPQLPSAPYEPTSYWLEQVEASEDYRPVRLVKRFMQVAYLVTATLVCWLFFGQPVWGLAVGSFLILLNVIVFKKSINPQIARNLYLKAWAERVGWSQQNVVPPVQVPAPRNIVFLDQENEIAAAGVTGQLKGLGRFGFYEYRMTNDDENHCHAFWSDAAGPPLTILAVRRRTSANWQRDLISRKLVKLDLRDSPAAALDQHFKLRVSPGQEAAALALLSPAVVERLMAEPELISYPAIWRSGHWLLTDPHPLPNEGPDLVKLLQSYVTETALLSQLLAP